MSSNNYHNWLSRLSGGPKRTESGPTMPTCPHYAETLYPAISEEFPGETLLKQHHLRCIRRPGHTGDHLYRIPWDDDLVPTSIGIVKSRY